MVTLIKYGALSGSEKYNVNQMWIDGLSTDSKPTTTIDGMGIPNGSVYTEVDTGKTYMFDKENVTWYEVSLGGGGGAKGGIVLVGETTTALTDNATTNPITVDGNSYTAKPNDAVIYGSKEFLFDGTKWHEFGDLSGLASKDIGAMTGYTKASTGSDIAPTDTLNQAIGKVEKRVDVNENNILSLQNEKPFNDVASSTNQKVIDAISDCRINVLDTSKSVKLVQVYKNYSNIYVITISIDGVNYHVLNKPTSAYTEVAYNAFSYTGVCDGYVIIDWSALDNNTLYSNINSELKQKYKNRYIEYETPKYKNVDIIIPNTVNVAVGKEISLEYFNIVKCSNISDYVVTFTTNNAQIQDYGSRLRIAPTQAATTSETVRVMYNGVEIIKKNFSIKAVTDTKPTIKAIFIGDSFTDGAIYLSELVNMLGTEKITLYGTRTTTAQDSDDNARTIYHEGRSGWSTSDYVNSSSKGGISNPFYNSGFDFSHYITNNPTFSDVTDVFVELGLNDGAGTGFETRYQTICNSIKSYNNNIRIHCLLPTPPCHDGRGFGSRNNISYVTFKDYMFNLCTKIKTLYDNTAGYYIVPTHANLDCWYDFPQTEVAVNSRNPEQITILDDNVHPTKYGYYRYADVVYSDIIANCQS